MSIMAKTPSGYKKIGSAYLGERPVDKVFNANGDVIYALQRELTGVLPLHFKGKEQSELWNYRICGNTETKQRDYSGSSPLTVLVHDGELYNYRIYGNTANGESVGEKTANLFDANDLTDGALNPYDGKSVIYSLQYYTQTYIPVLSNTDYTLSGVLNSLRCHQYSSDFTFLGSELITGTFTTNAQTAYIRLAGATSEFIQVMLNKGSTALPYEPYGYKVPITVTNSGTTSNETIYLPEPIKMVGSEAEYVDFYSQKQYFADGTNTAVTIPALPISTGTNTVTVNTIVQPSSVEVSTDENVSVGDLVTSGQHAGEYKVPVTVAGKNLLQNTAISQTINGVTFTVNSDGSVTCNGTASVSIFFSLKQHLQLEEGQSYYLTGCPTGGGGSSFRLYAQTDLGVNFYLDSGNGAIINYISQLEVLIVIYSGYTCDNLTFYPMIRKADIEDDTYEPYHAPVTTNIYLPEPIKMVGSEAEYIDYGEQKQHRVRKNLLQSTETSQTIKGVTFTVNADGSITCSGILTSGEYADLVISGVFLGDTDILENGNYVVSCANGSNNALLIVGNRKGEVGRVRAAEINISANLTWAILRIRQADPAITLYPMIRKADISDDTYEPYIENTDLDVTLPALPTIKGTNEMSVDTEVQPSRMDIKGRIKSLT